MSSSRSPLSSWTPAAPKPWLLLVAGMMWSGVGVFLCSLTIKWLQPVEIISRIWFIIGGLVLAFSIYWFGFSKLTDKNIQRIDSIPKEKVCIFAFQQWTSYPLVIFMIALGIVLRKYSPIPKPWLAGMYIGIGGSLFLASFHYFVAVWRNWLTI